eukprot:2524099-Amphidinium_carterae.2
MLWAATAKFQERIHVSYFSPLTAFSKEGEVVKSNMCQCRSLCPAFSPCKQHCDQPKSLTTRGTSCPYVILLLLFFLMPEKLTCILPHDAQPNCRVGLPARCNLSTCIHKHLMNSAVAQTAVGTATCQE